MEDIFELIWKAFKLFLNGLKLVFYYCSPARIIRKAIQRMNFFDYGKPFHVQLFWAGVDAVSWGIVIIVVVKLLAR